MNWDDILELVIFDELLQAPERARMGFHTDHSTTLPDGPRERQNLLSGPSPDIENDIARLGLVVPEKDGSCPRVQAHHVQPDVGVVVSKITVGGLVDPDPVVVEDPLDSVPGH